MVLMAQYLKLAYFTHAFILYMNQGKCLLCDQLLAV